MNIRDKNDLLAKLIQKISGNKRIITDYLNTYGIDIYGMATIKDDTNPIEI